jgi:hypothetical protein
MSSDSRFPDAIMGGEERKQFTEYFTNFSALKYILADIKINKLHKNSHSYLAPLFRFSKYNILQIAEVSLGIR